MKPAKVMLVLDRPRALAFDMNAMDFLEQHGFNVLENGLNVAMFKKAANLRILIAAMLVSDAEDNGETPLTPAQVGKLVDLATINEFNKQVSRLLNESLEEPTDDTPSPPVASDGA